MVGAAQALVVAGAAVLGLALGSFATVVAHRVPRRESVVGGRSRCPHCDHVITASENVPVLSWVLQGGRCRHCAERISPRYPAIELVSAVLFALSAWKFGLSPTGVVYAAFFWALVVLSVIDLEHGLLPNRIVVPTLVVGWLALALTALATGEVHRLRGALLGAALFAGFLVAVDLLYWWATRTQGLGGGDWKLATVLGTFLGYVGAPGVVLVGMFLSFLVGSVTGLFTMKIEGGDRKMAVPFGPSLAAGTVLAVFVGAPLLHAYVGLGR